MLIGVLVSGILEEYTQNICEGIERNAWSKDVRCVVLPGKYIGMDYETDLQNPYGYCFNSVFSYADLSCFDGLIIEMASLSMFATEEEKNEFISRFNNIPHVFVSYETEEVSNVSIDNKIGLRKALEYMYDNGARKFVMLGGPLANKDAAERKECFEEFISEHNLEYYPTSYEEGDFFLECDGVAERLIRNNTDADVIVCANDILAKRVYNVGKKYNMHPGKNVSVLGFDDSDFCVSTYPTISSIRTDVFELGAKSFQLLMDAINGKPPVSVKIPSRFILRDSICHRSTEIEESVATRLEFEQIIKSNIHISDNDEFITLGRDFYTILKLVDNIQNEDFNVIKKKVGDLVDHMFSLDSGKMIDGELFINFMEKRYSEVFASGLDSVSKNRIYSVYVDFLKKMMKLNHLNNNSILVSASQTICNMEGFFRDTMQFSRYSEQNYARFLNKLSFIEINNAYLYIYKEPVIYMQGEVFEVPKKMYLKAFLKNGVSKSVPQQEQAVKSSLIFDNEYVDWKNYNRLIVFPLFSENYLFGIVVCDMKREGFMSSEIFTIQLSSAVSILRLRMESNRILNEYEESVRKLKENNIELDTMSKTDPLTGLNNRRGFDSRSEKILEIYPNDECGLLVGYVDMNDLKIVNDKFGHDEGDFSLKTIGAILTDFVTGYNGFAARIGGDEFAFAFSVKNDCDIDFKEELYGYFNDFNNKSKKPYYLTVSMGYHIIKKDEPVSIDTALSIADEMLYGEKLLKKTNVIKE